ncbi:apolipoprotein N-acyltransferase [Glycomyces sp. L485]|uniref:apolipoprotein N-acyltransferase n=1 Tax=Glycomyces sp. L485 TaxID=2909235 RepID=UPI001F4B18FB|nr:apolipoprotein N-acyltransferase [Glycomyces sp. L485]MCH7231528.1 apolipoprotein N-acyltransferase [Glycomyces sp. L485]
MSTVIDRDAQERPAPPTSGRPRLALTVDSAYGRRLGLPAALMLALASGGAAVLAFPPYGWWPLAIVSVAGLGAAVHRRRPRAGLGIGFVYGMAFFLPLLAWSSTQVGQWPWVFLCALEALGTGILGAGLAACSRLIDRHRWAWAPLTGLAWVAQESLRSHQPFDGFPWGRLAFSQAEAPTAAAAWLGGPTLVSFLVALAAGLILTAVWRSPDWRKTAAFAAAAAVAVFGPLALPIGATAPDGDSVDIAVVQGNVPRLGLDFNEQRRAVLDNHVNATLDLAEAVNAGRADRPDLVVWPENASDIDPINNADAYELISDAAAAIGAPIVLGGLVTDDSGDRYNMSIVWDPVDGPVFMYAKQHPVPFAEYVPYKGFFRTVAGWIDPRMAAGIDSVAGFAPGTEPGVIPAAGFTISGSICFEVAFDHETRESIREGAQIMAVQTNNATFDTNEAQQQLAMVQLRSIEHGRDGLMASTVGVSAFTDHTGTLEQATEFNTAAVIQKELTLSERTTPATEAGILPEAILTGAAVAVLAAAAALNLRHRRADRRSPD